MGPVPAAEQGQENNRVQPDEDTKETLKAYEEGRLQSHSSVALTSTVIIITS